MVERDDRGIEIVYVRGKDLPTKFQWNKHINNLVEQRQMEKAMKNTRDMMNLGIAERMYFWLCKMRDFRIKPNHHTVKPFTCMHLYFPAVDEPFWTTDFGMPFDPRRHGCRR